MRYRWVVLFLCLLVVFPLQVAGFCQGVAQSLISGADASVDAPTTTVVPVPGGDLRG